MAARLAVLLSMAWIMRKRMLCQQQKCCRPLAQTSALGGTTDPGRENLLPLNCNRKRREHQAHRPEAQYTAHLCEPGPPLASSGMNPPKAVAFSSQPCKQQCRLSRQGHRALSATCPQGTGHFTSENLYPQATSSETYTLRAVPGSLLTAWRSG